MESLLSEQGDFMAWLPFLLISVLLGYAVRTDLVARRIPNSLILAGLLAALACHLLLPAGRGLFMPEAGSPGLGQAVLGMLCGGAVLFPLWAAGVLGAGDVKLMAVLGAFLGPWQVCGALLLTAAAGGLLAIFAALISGVWRQVWSNLRLMLMCLMVGKSGGLRLSDMPSTGRLPYALAITCGALGQIVLARSGEWPFV